MRKIWKDEINILRKVRIKQRLIISFIIVSVIPLFILGIYTYSKSNDAIKSKISTYSVQIINQISANISLQVASLETMGDSFVATEIVQDTTADYSTMTDAKKADTTNLIMDIVTKKMSEYPLIKNFELDNYDGSEVFSLGFGNLSKPDKERLTNIAKEDGGGACWSTFTLDNKVNLAITRQINNSSGTKPLGYLFVLVDESYLKNVYKDVNIGDNAKVFIMDKKGTVLSSNNKDMPNGTVVKQKDLVEKIIKLDLSKQQVFDLEYSGDKELVSCSSINKGEMFVVSLIPYKYINSEASSIKFGMIIMLIICILFSVIFAYIISVSISNPLKRLVSNMEYVEKGNLRNLKDDNADDEIAEVSKSFIKMISNISVLIEKIRVASDQVLNCTLDIDDCAKNAGNAADQISVSMDEVSKGAYSQANEISTEVNLTSKLSDGINMMVDEIKKVIVSASGLKNVSMDAASTIRVLNDKTRISSEISMIMVANINKLGNEIKEIRNIVKVISKISEQTNLLALNAAIEAAKAGVQGKGFAVISGEIRKLSEQVKDSSNHINNTISRHLVLIEGTVREIERSSCVAKEQTDIVEKTDEAFSNIHNELNSIIHGIENIERVAGDIYNIKDKTLSSMECVSAISQETSALSQEVTATTQQQFGIFTKLIGSTEELKRTTYELDESISIFNICDK